MKFKKLTDKKSFELADYVKTYLADHKYHDIKLYMGCDSQTRGGSTTYATTLVFHVSSSGCHVIYKKEILPEIKDAFWEKSLIVNFCLLNVLVINSLPIDESLGFIF